MRSFVSKDEVFVLAVDCGAPIEFLQSLANLYTVQLGETLTENSEPQVEMAVEFYDQSEIHHNCAVEIFSNSVTGDVSIGWWHEDEDDDDYDEDDDGYEGYDF